MPGVEIPRISEVPIESAEDQTWDPDKAATLAAALKEEGPLDADLAHRDAAIERSLSPDYSFEGEELARLQKKKEGLEARLSQLEAESPEAEAMQTEISRQQEHIEVAQRAVDAQRAETADTLMGQTHDNADRFLLGDETLREHELADELMKGPEDLYDANPDLFAAMPTAEFMAIVREGERISQEIRSWDDAAEAAHEYSGRLEAHADNKAVPSWPFLSEYSNRFGRLNCGPAEKIQGIYKSGWEKNDQQKAAEYKVVFAEVLQECEAGVASAQSKLTEFMSKYAPSKDAKAPEVAPES